MKLFTIITTLCIISYTRTEENISEIIDLRAVTHFEEIEEYYKLLRTQKFGGELIQPPQEPTNNKKKVQIKKNICKNIFTSHYFKMLQEDWLNVDLKSIRAQLQNECSDTFNSVYKEQQRNIVLRYLCDKYEYENNYYVEAIHMGNNAIDEYVFKCFVKERESSRIKVYFVSQEYNVNSYDSYPMAGRFIFSHNDDHQLVLKAIAEEAIIGSRIANMMQISELMYAMQRSVHVPSETDIDPICKLTTTEKLRLCTAVFASSIYQNKLTFSPTVENVLLDCQKKEISFMASLYRPLPIIGSLILFHIKRSGPRVYEEWMIGCKASMLRTNESITYYVSRGDIMHSVFTYNHKSSDEKLFVDNYLNNASVVDELRAPAEAQAQSENEDVNEMIESVLSEERDSPGETDDEHKVTTMTVPR